MSFHGLIGMLSRLKVLELRFEKNHSNLLVRTINMLGLQMLAFRGKKANIGTFANTNMKCLCMALYGRKFILGGSQLPVDASSGLRWPPAV